MRRYGEAGSPSAAQPCAQIAFVMTGKKAIPPAPAKPENLPADPQSAVLRPGDLIDEPSSAQAPRYHGKVLRTDVSGRSPHAPQAARYRCRPD
jgi:hypothetical protein